jgi:alkylation response protein AidB-like acyl-CoA dehydrogenase
MAAIPFTNEHRARIRSATTWVSRTAVSLVDTAFAAAGGGSLYTASPLQRRLRDIHALNQHVAFKSDVFAMTGAVLTGQAVDLTFL